MNYEKIGILIRSKRKELRLTQKELSALAQVSNTALQSIERGEFISMNTMQKILLILGYEIKIVNSKTLKIIDLQ